MCYVYVYVYVKSHLKTLFPIVSKLRISVLGFVKYICLLAISAIFALKTNTINKALVMKIAVSDGSSIFTQALYALDEQLAKIDVDFSHLDCFQDKSLGFNGFNGMVPQPSQIGAMGLYMVGYIKPSSWEGVLVIFQRFYNRLLLGHDIKQCFNLAGYEYTTRQPAMDHSILKSFNETDRIRMQELLVSSTTALLVILSFAQFYKKLGGEPVNVYCILTASLKLELPQPLMLKMRRANNTVYCLGSG